MAIADHLQDPGVDAIFGIQAEYQKDIRKDKVNLTVGVYVEDDSVSPPVMRALSLAEQRVVAGEVTKDYLGIAGDQEYLSFTAKLVFGEVDQASFSMIQTVGGTSALRTGFEFLRKNGHHTLSISNPTWANHNQIASNLDFTVVTYPQVEGVQNFSLVENHLQELEEGTVVLLQAKCHNPTGVDFSKEQWKKISAICKKKKLFPFFDSAYQGFACSLEEDAWAVRYFFEQGHDMMVAHSYSKSFAIYNERVGALFATLQDKSILPVVTRNLERIVRVNYSNPPFHGAASVKEVLKEESLTKIWQEELSEHRMRLNSIRKKFGEALIPIFGKDVARTILEGNGFFCQIPLTRKEIDRLKEEFGIYMTYSGRVSLPGLKQECFSFVVDAIRKVKG